MRVSTFSWPKPRRGSLFSMSTSSRDGVRAIRRDARGDPLGDGHHPTAHDERPVVGAMDVGLHHHVAAAALAHGDGKRLADIRLGPQVQAARPGRGCRRAA